MIYSYFYEVANKSYLDRIKIGESVRFRYLKQDTYIYEVICLTDKYSEVYIGEKYFLFLPKIGDGIIYIIEYSSGVVLLAKLDINECVNFMTPAVYRDFQMTQILGE